jgi:hypothetical protein
MARLEEVTIGTQEWKERRCEDSSKQEAWRKEEGREEERRGKEEAESVQGERETGGDTKHDFPHI